jgi:hypothetical protein
MIEIYAGFIKILGWLVVSAYLIKYRKNIPVNIFYLMLFSTCLMLHSEIYDIVYKVVVRNPIWFFADIAVMTVYVSWINRYKKYQNQIKEDIQNFISKINDK